MAISISDAGIKVSIVRNTQAVSQRGFGSIGFATRVAAITDRIKLYTSLEGVQADHPIGSEPYNAATSWYSQVPRPEDFFVIQALDGPASTPAEGTFVLATNATGDGIVGLDIDGVQYDVTPTAADTPDVVAAALAPIITAGGTHTAVAVTDTITITDNVPGTAGNAVVFTDVTADSTMTGTATDPSGGTDGTGESLVEAFSAAALINPDFYCCAVDATYRDEDASLLELGAWVQTNDRTFVLEVNNPDVLDDTVTTDICSKLQARGFTNTYSHYSSTPAEYGAVGAFGILATTSFRGANTLKTLKFKDIGGLTTENIEPADLAAIKAKSCNVLYTTAAIRMCDEGIMAPESKTYFDEIHGTHALAEEIRVRVFGLFARNPTKIPYTEDGMSLIKGEVEGALDQYVTNGFLASALDDDGNYLPAYTVTSGAVAEASTNDRALRQSPDVQFSARLAGAVHSVLISGELFL